jgi:hypothetical protein
MLGRLFPRKEMNMRRTWFVLAVLLVLGGGLFFLQGTGVLPYGGMANHIEWAYIGGGMVIVAVILIAVALRRPPSA